MANKKPTLRNPFEKKPVHLISEDLRKVIPKGDDNVQNVRETKTKEKTKEIKRSWSYR